MININEFKQYLESKDIVNIADIDNLFNEVGKNFKDIVTELNLHSNYFTKDELEEGKFNFDAIVNDINIEFEFLYGDDDFEGDFIFELSIIKDNHKLVLPIDFNMIWEDDEYEADDEGGITLDTGTNYTYYKLNEATFTNEYDVSYYPELNKQKIILDDKDIKDKIEKLNTDLSLLLSSINFNIYKIN